MRIFEILGLLKDCIKYRTFDLPKIIEAKNKEIKDLKAKHKKMLKEKEAKPKK